MSEEINEDYQSLDKKFELFKNIQRETLKQITALGDAWNAAYIETRNLVILAGIEMAEEEPETEGVEDSIEGYLRDLQGFNDAFINKVEEWRRIRWKRK